MWFKKAEPPPPVPSAQNEEEFVKWLLQYSGDLSPFRSLYKNNLEGFVYANWNSLKREIEEHDLRSADALMMRGGEIAEFYQQNFKHHVENRGGLHRCPTDFQAAAVIMLVKVQLMLYLAKHKYGAPIPEELLGMTKLNS